MSPYRLSSDGYGQRPKGGYRPGPSATSAFVPTDLANLALWLDAADAATITASSGAVSQWNDKSGNARHVLQASAGAQPRTGTRALNGRNVIDFDGGDVLKTAARIASVAQPTTYFVVLELDVAAGWVVDSFDAGSTRQILYVPSGQWSLNAGTLLGAGGSSTDPEVVTGVFNGVSSSIRRNGTSVASGNAGANAMQGFTIGASYVPNNWVDGAIAEVIAYAAALSTEDRDTVEAYLAAKWGVTF